MEITEVSTSLDRLFNIPVSRRAMLRSSAAAFGAIGVNSLLAACGGDDDESNGPVEEPSTPTEDTTGSESDEGTPEATTEVGDSDEGTPPEVGEGSFGGTFIAAMQTAPPQLDFMSSTAAATRIVARPSIEPLITVGDDYTAVPMLAESWEANDDGTVISFHLRQNVKFHNGATLTADDVVASMDRFFEVSPRTGEFEMVDSYEALDDSTIEFRLNIGTLSFIDAMAFPLGYPGILPRDVIESISGTDVQVEHMVGTGPYRFVEWIPDQAVRYERFEDYTSRDEPRNGLAGGKVAYFDEIEYTTVTETSARTAGLETGEYDYDAAPVTTAYDRLKEDSETAPYINENGQMDFILFNLSDPITGNLKFRQAIQAGAKLEDIALAIANGREEFVGLQPSLWFSTTAWNNDAGADLYNQADLDKAKSLLEESGYDGEELTIITNRSYDSMYKNIITLDEFLRTELEINTKVEVLDFPAQAERISGPEGWHIAPTWIASAATFGPGPWAVYFETGTTGATAGYSVPEMDEAFRTFRTTTSQEERFEAARTIQRVFYETIPFIKVCDTYLIEALRADVSGFEPYYEPRFWGCWREE